MDNVSLSLAQSAVKSSAYWNLLMRSEEDLCVIFCGYHVVTQTLYSALYCPSLSKFIPLSNKENYVKLPKMPHLISKASLSLQENMY